MFRIALNCYRFYIYLSRIESMDATLKKDGNDKNEKTLHLHRPCSSDLVSSNLQRRSIDQLTSRSTDAITHHHTIL